MNLNTISLPTTRQGQQKEKKKAKKLKAIEVWMSGRCG
jgi:hypothetical protein